jgi:hypothetical protein
VSALAFFVLAIGRPDEGPSIDVPDGFLILLVAAGFIIGAIGHLTKIKTFIATGIAMIFIATLVLPLVAFLDQ